MPIVCEVPTHLNVGDAIVFGLGAHQLVRLAAGGSVAYVVWDQATALQPELRATTACLLIAAGVACALLQPGGRPLDRWALVCALYLSSPRHFVWRHELSSPEVGVHDESDWADSMPELDWVDRPNEGANTANRRRT